MDEQTNLTGVQKTKFSSIKNLTSFFIVILCFFLPIFFIPSQSFSFLAGKDILLVSVTFLLLLFWVFERVKNRDFLISKNLMVISALLVPFLYLIASLFSGSIKLAIFGSGFGVNSFSMVLTLFLLMFLVARLFQTKKKIIYVYLGLLFSAILMLFFHVLRLIFGPEFLSLGVLKTTTANLIGTWSELGIFFGLIAILSLLTAVFISGGKVIKIVSYISLGVFLFFVALINFFAVWLMLSLLSLTIVIYYLLMNKTSERKISRKNISVVSLIVFVVSLIFIFAKGPVGNFLPETFNILNFEVRPSIGNTIDVAQATLANDPFFGAGPNGFTQQWALNKPLEINNSQFWNINFNSGSSFILTTLVNIGLLGFLAWLLFFGMIIYSGVKLLKTARQNKFNHYLAISVFLTTIYLWSFSILYVPSTAIFGLSFLFTGLLLSLLYQDRVVKIKTISLARSLTKSIVLIVVVATGLIAVIFNGYLFIKKVNASVQFNKGLIAINVDQNFSEGYQSIINAANKYPSDVYFRSITDLNLMQLQNILNQKDIEAEELQKQFQDVFSITVGSAERAIQLDQKNYQNWANLSKVYGAVIPLGVEKAYDQAVQINLQAINLNPNNPALVLNLANLEIANGDIEKAKEYVMTSIQMKRNYSDAYYLLSQIESSAGNEAEAIKIIEALAQETPNDPEVFLQLGFYKYNAKNYTEAIPLLERSVSLNQYLVDAVYLLGLSYSGAGEDEKAVEMFDYLSQAIPDDNNLTVILDNLRNGRDPLFGLEQQPAEIPTTEVIEEDTSLELELDLEENEEVN